MLLCLMLLFLKKKIKFHAKKEKKNMNGLENKEATFSCSVIHNGSPQQAFPHI